MRAGIRSHLALILVVVSALAVACVADQATFGAASDAGPSPAVAGTPRPASYAFEPGRYHYTWTRTDGASSTAGVVTSELFNIGGATAIRDTFPNGEERMLAFGPYKGGLRIVREDVLGETVVYMPELPMYVPSRDARMPAVGWKAVWGSAFASQGGSTTTRVAPARTVLLLGRPVAVVRIERSGHFRSNGLDGTRVVVDAYAPSIGVLVERRESFTGTKDGARIKVRDLLRLVDDRT